MVADIPPRFPPGLGRGNNLLNTLQNQRLLGKFVKQSAVFFLFHMFVLRRNKSGTIDADGLYDPLSSL